MHRKPKVSPGRLVRGGLVGRPKGVDDGHQVDIPELPIIRMRCVGTQEDRHASDWMCLFKRVASLGRKIRSDVRK